MSAGFPNREALQAAQLDRLRALIKAARSSNRFQAGKLAGLKSDSELASLDEFTRAVPFTTKLEIATDQLANPPYGTNLTFPIERYTRFHQTSGTSGIPIPWLDTPESWDAMAESWVEVYRAAGVTKADRIFFAFSFGPFIGFWLAFESAERLGALCIPGGGLSSSARVKMILNHEATVVCCTPTYAIRLAEVAAQEGVDLRSGKVQTLILAGEPGASIPATRSRIQELWGAKPFDHHGMTEVGPVTYECPAEPGVLHVIESAFLPEVIHPETGLPVPDGQEGELVLTTLIRVGSPLLRYRTGDLVKARPAHDSDGAVKPCDCGRHELALEGGILGRVDDMVVVRGVNIYPCAVEELIRRVGGIAEYRVTISSAESMAEMSLEVEPAPEQADPAHLADKVSRAFEEAMALRVPVRVAEAGSLPRYEHKARRWVRKES